MRKKERYTALLLAAALAVSTLAGCGGSGGSGSKEDPAKTEAQDEGGEGTADEETAAARNAGEVEPGYLANADDPIDLTWYINYSWFTTGWGESMVSQAITEKTGVNIEFVVPAGNEAEKLNSLIASDNLPDVLTLGWWESQVGDMIDAEMVYALDELADEYDMYFWNVADEARVSWYTQDDGHIYGYPNSSYSPQDYEKYDNIPSNQTFLVRKDMYEAIGSPDMTTPEGFKDAIRKVAEMYPEVNGQPLIPIGAHEFVTDGCVSFDQYFWNFIALDREDEDGNIADRRIDEEYITWLKAFRELGEEGYLNDEIFIDKRAQMEEKMAQGRYFCALYQRTDMATQQKILYTEDPEKIYMAIDGPKNSKGDDHILPGGSINGWTVTMISKNCENPDRAIQLLSYMMSEEGQMMLTVGVEGEMYDMVDGLPVVKEEIKELMLADRVTYDNQYGGDNCYWMMMDNAMQDSWAEPIEEPLAQMLEWTYPYSAYTGQYDVTLATDTPEANASLKIDAEWGITLPKLLLASSEEEFDQILQAFVERRDEFGYDIVQTEVTRQVKENKAKLGLE